MSRLRWLNAITIWLESDDVSPNYEHVSYKPINPWSFSEQEVAEQCFPAASPDRFFSLFFSGEDEHPLWFSICFLPLFTVCFPTEFICSPSFIFSCFVSWKHFRIQKTFLSHTSRHRLICKRWRVKVGGVAVERWWTHQFSWQAQTLVLGRTRLSLRCWH